MDFIKLNNYFKTLLDTKNYAEAHKVINDMLLNYQDNPCSYLNAALLESIDIKKNVFDFDLINTYLEKSLQVKKPNVELTNLCKKDIALNYIVFFAFNYALAYKANNNVSYNVRYFNEQFNLIKDDKERNNAAIRVLFESLNQRAKAIHKFSIACKNDFATDITTASNREDIANHHFNLICDNYSMLGVIFDFINDFSMLSEFVNIWKKVNKSVYEIPTEFSYHGVSTTYGIYSYGTFYSEDSDYKGEFTTSIPNELIKASKKLLSKVCDGINHISELKTEDESELNKKAEVVKVLEEINALNEECDKLSLDEKKIRNAANELSSELQSLKLNKKSFMKKNGKATYKDKVKSIKLALKNSNKNYYKDIAANKADVRKCNESLNEALKSFFLSF